MIKVFFGPNRKMAVEAAQEYLGEGYEVIDGGELLPAELANIFWGNSMFSETRKIMVRDLLANKAAAMDLPKYLETAHKIALLEMNVDKRSVVYKSLKDKVEWMECKMPKSANFGVVFDIYRTAKRDGAKAVEMLEKIQNEEDPVMFTGLLATQAMKDYAERQGATEKERLKKIAKLDLELKSTAIEPWMLVKATLLGLK
ncbi:hypothetical protein IKE87_02945 [Candidatus Saccharibacteria bacterium]|nr:hypothetical protein [Candidatus Saccharibacteria bacterium]